MDYDYLTDEELEVEENVQIIQCYCEGHCPFGDTRGICQITSPGGKCYAAVFFEKDEDGEEFPKVAFGCQPDAQMAMLQCKGSLIPHHLNKNAIECCDDGDFCNKDVFAEYAAAPSDPWWPHAPPLHLALFLLLALSLAAALAAAAVLLVKYRRAVARFRGGAANEEEGRAAKEEEGRSAGVGRAVGEGQPPRAAAAGKLAQLIEQSSGSGKGLPLMVQRTIAKQIEMERIVGRGRYGEVWLAKWRGERVAAKIFHSMDEKSWIRETAVYQSVLMRHENLLGFIAADIKGTGWTQMLLITDYHEKGSLFDYLRTYSLNPDTLVTLSWSISRGLTHLHTEIHGVHGKPSIAHRDIKSKNILVKDNGECCIADFGLAVQFEANTNNINLPETNVKSGTKRYMAPEILDGTMETQNFESHKMADIYAFALVLWEMSTRCAFGSHEAMPYQIPYHDAVPSDPTFEQMCQLVCVEKARPKIPTTWKTHETMNIIMKTMQEMWHEYPGARLTALRIKKTLSRLKPSKDNSQPS